MKFIFRGSTVRHLFDKPTKNIVIVFILVML